VTPNDRVAVARLWAVALTVLSFLPFANWIAGGHAAPFYSLSAAEWASGSAISVGMAVVLFLVLRRFGLWPSGWARLADAAVRNNAMTSLVLGGLSVALFGAIARKVLSGRPLLIDEIAQVMQARIFAEGRLARVVASIWVLSAPCTLLYERPGVPQLPGGADAAAGLLTGLVAQRPCLGAIAVVAFWHVVRSTEHRREQRSPPRCSW
jgi:hypothetical protein